MLKKKQNYIYLLQRFDGGQVVETLKGYADKSLAIEEVDRLNGLSLNSKHHIRFGIKGVEFIGDVPRNLTWTKKVKKPLNKT